MLTYGVFVWPWVQMVVPLAGGGDGVVSSFGSTVGRGSLIRLPAWLTPSVLKKVELLGSIPKSKLLPFKRFTSVCIENLAPKVKVVLPLVVVPPMAVLTLVLVPPNSSVGSPIEIWPASLVDVLLRFRSRVARPVRGTLIRAMVPVKAIAGAPMIAAFLVFVAVELTPMMAADLDVLLALRPMAPAMLAAAVFAFTLQAVAAAVALTSVEAVEIAMAFEVASALEKAPPLAKARALVRTVNLSEAPGRSQAWAAFAATFDSENSVPPAGLVLPMRSKTVLEILRGMLIGL